MYELTPEEQRNIDITRDINSEHERSMDERLKRSEDAADARMVLMIASQNRQLVVTVVALIVAALIVAFA